MEQTTNYNLKKPEYTDFADIQDINDNMDTIDELLAAPTGDTADSTATFTCSDVADGEAAAWTNVPALTSGETHKSIFAKMSQMFKNLRYLYKLLGTTDISSIGNGTVTDGLSSLNDSLAETDNKFSGSSFIIPDMNDTSYYLLYFKAASIRFFTFAGPTQNKPVSDYGTCLIYYGGNHNDFFQYCFTSESGTYYRSNRNGAWSSWKSAS